MNVFKYCAKLMQDPAALWEPPLETITSLPVTLALTFDSGQKGSVSWYAPVLRSWTNAKIVEAIKMNMAHEKRVEIVSPYKLSANDKQHLTKLGASIFSSPNAQTLYDSVKVKVTLADSLDRMSRLTLNAVLSL